MATISAALAPAELVADRHADCGAELPALTVAVRRALAVPVRAAQWRTYVAAVQTTERATVRAAF